MKYDQTAKHLKYNKVPVLDKTTEVFKYSNIMYSWRYRPNYLKIR